MLRTKIWSLLICYFAGILMLSGCTRYARSVNVLYEPSVAIQNGIGEIHLIIPESQQTQSSDIRWTIGSVTDGGNMKIDDVDSSRSPAEIIRAAFTQELKKGGYTVTPGTRMLESDGWAIDLTKTEIKIDQVSEFSTLKATCRVVAGMDVYKNGRLVKKLEYEASSSRTDIKDRDILAQRALEDALQSLMQKAVPDLDSLFKQ